MTIRPSHIRAFQQRFNLGDFLTETNPKVTKSQKVFDAPTAVLHLLPKYRGSCPFAGTCSTICLHNAGNPAYMKGKQLARKKRTDAYMDAPIDFMNYLTIELVKFAYKHRDAKIRGVRLNGTSDIMWEKQTVHLTVEVSNYLYKKFGIYIRPARYRNIFYMFRECSSWYSYPELSGKNMFYFYDYTKRTDRLFHVCKHDGYHLTMSIGSSGNTLQTALDEQLNIAAAFNIPRGKDLPLFVNIEGYNYPVLDGDVTDFRPFDASDKRYVVGLRMKRVPGMTQKQVSNFVVA